MEKSTSVFIILVILSRLFGFQGLPLSGGVITVLYFAFTLFIIYDCFTSKNKFKPTKISYTIIAWQCIILFSVVVAYFIGGQTPYYSLRTIFSVFFTPLLLFFYLRNHNVSNKDLKKTFIYLTVTYIIIYSIQFVSFPHILFTSSGWDQDDIEADAERRGVARLWIPYEDIIAIVLFYVISQKRMNINNKVLIILIFTILTIMRGTRFIIASTLFTSFILWLKVYIYDRKQRIQKGTFVNNIVKYTAIIFCLFLVCKYVVTKTNLADTVSYYQERTEMEADQEEDNIRVAMSAYYLFEFNKSVSEVIFGHGIASKGDFATVKEELTDIGFYADDVGYVEIYLYFGIIGIVALLAFPFFVYKTKVPKEYEFARYYIFYIFIAMICGRYFLNNQALIAVMLYIIDKNNTTLGLNDRKRKILEFIKRKKLCNASSSDKMANCD